MPTQLMPHHQRSAGPTHAISAPFIDQSQYLTAIPVQSVFPVTATVISPLQPPPDYVQPGVVVAPGGQVQDHLQRKHEELQKLIVQQQDELRRVSEQLFMARYGMLPPLVNVSVPFVATTDQTEAGESSRCISTSSNMSHLPHTAYYEQPPVMHHTQVSSQSQINPQLLVPNSSQPVMHQQLPIQYDMTPQKRIDQQAINTDRQNEDILQYMQHQSQPIQPHHLPPQHHQIDEFELMPFQMMNQQAQILFSSGNNNDSANNSSSNKWMKSISCLTVQLVKAVGSNCSSFRLNVISCW